MRRFIALTIGIILGFTVLAYAAFSPHQQVPHIGTVRVTLTKTVNPDKLGQEAIIYQVEIDDQEDRQMSYKSGDLTPHLTAGQITQLEAFMDVLWQKAEDEILP